MFSVKYRFRQDEEIHFKSINVNWRNSYTNNSQDWLKSTPKMLVEVSLFKTLSAVLHLKGFFEDAFLLNYKHGGTEQNSGHNLNQSLNLRF